MHLIKESVANIWEAKKVPVSAPGLQPTGGRAPASPPISSEAAAVDQYAGRKKRFIWKDCDRNQIGFLFLLKVAKIFLTKPRKHNKSWLIFHKSKSIYLIEWTRKKKIEWTRRHNILCCVRLKKTFHAHTDGGLLMFLTARKQSAEDLLPVTDYSWQCEICHSCKVVRSPEVAPALGGVQQQGRGSVTSQ